MLWFILAFGLILVGFILWYTTDDVYNDFADTVGALGVFLSIGGVVVLFIVSLASVGVKSDWRTLENDYAFTKELIENYEPGDDYGNVAALTEKVLELNKSISKHRGRHDSPWWNIWYSEEIGNLEPLKLPKGK